MHKWDSSSSPPAEGFTISLATTPGSSPLSFPLLIHCFFIIHGRPDPTRLSSFYLTPFVNSLLIHALN
ncbi:hypothetical protein LINPERHAP1_LOCUS20318 [Linum perenne]